MSQDPFDSIIAKQQELARKPFAPPPRHEPEILYIGCIDARLDPIDDLGIPKGKALIYRNIGALVRPEQIESETKAIDKDAVLRSGEIPENVSMGAALEFFLNHIPAVDGRPKRIIVSGHTNCGGIAACVNHACKSEDRYLPHYLSILEPAREAVMQQAKESGWNQDRIYREMEESTVRYGVNNLENYEVVRRALDKDGLKLHGWVIETGNGRIHQMNPETKQFSAMEATPDMGKNVDAYLKSSRGDMNQRF